jgi:phage gp36-like protein
MAAYATIDQLHTFGAPASTFGSLTDQQKTDALEAASREADGSLRARGTLPLTAWEDDLTSKVCAIATMELLVIRGFNPNAGADALLVKRSDDAKAWLRGVAKGEIHPDVTYSASPSTSYARPRVVSSDRRGW